MADDGVQHKIVVTGTPGPPSLVDLFGTASKYQPLVDRAEALLNSVEGALPSGVEFTRDAVRESPNMRVFAELTALVRDLAKALVER